MAVTTKAAQLRGEGKEVIGLGAGEPDFDTPEAIKQAAQTAMAQGKTKYTPVDGTVELKQAIIDKFSKENQLDYQLNQVIVSAGGKQCFYNLAQILLNPGDEVIIPAPFWVSYPDIVMLADAVPVIVFAGPEQQFKITPEQLQQALSPMTRLLVLNSPSNPTGQAYSKQDLTDFGDILKGYPEVLVVTDDIYEHIYWPGKFQNIVNVCPDLYDRSIVLNGVSKAYSMTGWRIGYAAGPSRVIKAMKTLQSQSTSNPASISQAAALEALTGDQSFIEKMSQTFKSRHGFIVKGLNDLPGVDCLESVGTFYCFPNFTDAMKKLAIKDDVTFAEYILNEILVALVPGSAFGAAGHLRLSFATSMENLQQALARLQKLIT